MPTVTSNAFTVSISNAPHTSQNVYVDIASLLSKHYGKTIRQGNNFKVCGIQVSLIPKDTSTDFDSGMAVSSKISYVPTTKHTRKAWNECNSMWYSQKKLRAGIGSATNYDEMEFAFDSAHSYARASSLFQGGLADSDSDTMVLIGTSSESQNRFALQDFYNSQHPVGSVSRYSYDNSTIKDRKYDAFFPAAHVVYTSSVLSAAVSEAGEAPAVYLSAAQAQNPMTMFESPLNVLTGMLKVQNYVVTDDTTTQIEDECYLQVSVNVKSWTSLFYRRKSYNRRGRGAGKKSPSTGRRTRTRRTYRKGRK